ncbi:hypothetical protein H632_c1854p1 [Helicosporidium sp. ATCC 50920]|nr:hypothetical protein H632_c1854p1 [Helicosporidium sp. ATCC 50920]|eukprot:KDD73767.1 hypothetical protein H632_c1854p1 [Helicosporidium sp. ATCC 50920]
MRSFSAPAADQWEVDFRAWQSEFAARYSKELPDSLIEEQTVEEHGTQLNVWKAQPRTTPADVSNDRRSLRRRLDQRLFMLVRPRGGSKGPLRGEWTLPMREAAEETSVREAAEKALAEALEPGEAVQTYFVGNSPAGHWAAEAKQGEDEDRGEERKKKGQKKEPKSETRASDATLFFMRCQLIKGTPALAAGGAFNDAVWVAKDELHEYLPPSLVQVLRVML